MNTFMENLTNATNFAYTENGAVAKKSTNSATYDLFALGAAYRERSEDDCILLFKEAFNENPLLALKCLFYLRDIRGGAGERRFFRVCYRWLACHYPTVAKENLINISEYGRWDDLIYSTLDTPVEKDALNIIKHQLALDIQCFTPSLLAKWLPSENASSKTTKKAANVIRLFLNMSHKQYRKTLSILRKRINVLERLMSENKWDEIEFDKIPSRAGLIYKNAFARRDIISKKYEAFVKSKDTKVNADALYPYDIVRKALCNLGSVEDTDRVMVNKYWENLPDYFEGKECSLMCVVDTSGSMAGTPINMAISLGLYCAERLNGPFKDHYISFSSRPQLIKTNGVDFVDKVRRIYNTNLCENTNLKAVFDLIKSIALDPSTKKEDVPKTLVVISDMQIDYMTDAYYWLNGAGGEAWTEKTTSTEMEKIRREWEAAGLEMPRLIYWNVNASKDTILDASPDVSFVSGASPIIFKQIITGRTGYSLMLDILHGERYKKIKI